MQAYTNFLEQVQGLELFDSLQVIQAYFQFFQLEERLPSFVQVPINFYQLSKMQRGIHEWDLVILLREVLLYAKKERPTGNTLANYNQLVKALKGVIAIEHELYEENKEIFSANVWSNLYRVMHRQIPWQERQSAILCTRYFKIYSDSKLQEIVKKQFGISVKEIYTHGLASIGFLMRAFAIDPNQKSEIPGINPLTIEKFIANFSVSLEQIQSLISENNEYGPDYLYHFNLLRQYPIIKVKITGAERLIVPIPRLLFNRFTDGLFYEICNESGFASAYGNAFQTYIGAVLHKTNIANNFQIIEETRYSVKGEDKRTADWVVADKTGTLFIECKTKRLRAQGKITLVNNKYLDEDLDILAGAVVQVYKTIMHYKGNLYPHFKYNGKKVYPLVVTLEDWILFGSQLQSQLNEKIAFKLRNAGMPSSLITDFPYSVCSADEFEILMRTINHHSIEQVMEAKTEKSTWPMHNFLANTYREDFMASTLLFPEEYTSLVNL